MVKSPLSDVEVPEVPLVQALTPLFQAFSERTALIDGITGAKYTFEELITNFTKVASGLRRLGVRKGDVVSLFCPNCPEWVFMFFGILANGASVTTVNPAYTTYELTQNLKDSDTKIIFTNDTLKKTVLEAVKNSGGVVQKVIILGKTGSCGCGCIDFKQLIEDDGGAFPEDVVINPRVDVATIPYSSGTTGLPKGVMITHFNIMSQMVQLGHPSYQDPDQEEENMAPPVLIAFLPFFHAYGMIAIMMGGLARGGTIVTLPRFLPEQFLATCEKYKVSLLPLVPPVVVLLNNSPLLKKYDLSSVKRIGVGAAPLAKDTELEFAKKFGIGELRQGYGMTETTCVTSMFLPTSPSKPGSCGLPLPNTEIQIVDLETKKVMGPNERGEIWIRGPQIMKGYHNKPEATASTLDKDGWLHSGDIGYYDEECYLYVVDRLKELIKYKAFQVAPAELEALLLNHPKVVDVGVVGIPDPVAGEVPRAFVVKMQNTQVSEQELKDFVAERLAKFKHLYGGVEFVDVIPKSPSGKILRRLLRERGKQSKL